MSYLLDTNACVAALRDQNGNVAQRLGHEPPGDVAKCFIVKAELYYGAYKSNQSAATLLKLGNFLKQFRSFSMDDAAAEVYGQIRASLELAGTPIGPNDLMIAAIALANNLVVVTNNTREFTRVPALRLEDWA